MNTATLTLGNNPILYLPYNPNTVFWNYDLNRQMIDTYGGRVVQILSVVTQSMEIMGDAGSRPRLLQLFKEFRGLQDKQIVSKNSATLIVPATFAENGQISQKVWLQNMEVGITRESVTYPYRITVLVEDQYSEFISNAIKNTVLQADFNRLNSGVGFVDDGKYQGIGGSQLSLGQLSNLVYNGG